MSAVLLLFSRVFHHFWGSLSSSNLIIKPCFLWTPEYLVFVIFVSWYLSFYSQHILSSQRVTNGGTHNELFISTWHTFTRTRANELEQKTMNSFTKRSLKPAFVFGTWANATTYWYAQKEVKTLQQQSVHSQEQNRLPANATKIIKADVCAFCSTSITKWNWKK